jgi:hypothetical protein
MEEAFVVFIVVFVLMMVVFGIAYVIGVSRAKKKVGVFSQFIKQHFPEVGDSTFLSASQASKSSILNIALLIDEARRRIIILQDVKGTGITSKVYAFDNFLMVDPLHRIIERGAWPNKVYSYEKSLTLRFDDGTMYQMFLEFITNKAGTDKGPGIINQTFAPWEEKLGKIARREI